MHRHVLLFVSALAAAALLGCPAPGPESVVFEVTADSSSDFGSVVLNAPSQELTFTVKNSGGGKSDVIAMTTEGIAAAAFRVTTDNCSGTQLEAGGTCSVGVTMTPRSAGAKTAQLTARDSRGSGQLAIRGAGVTRALLQVSPTSSAFGTVATGGTSTDATFTVTNTGSQATGALAVTLGGAQANQFTKPTDTCDTKTLAAGATCTIKVRFAPSAVGAATAAVTVTGTPGGTVTIPVGGTGGTPATLMIAPTTKDYAMVDAGTQSADTTFTVTNTGAVNATALTVALGGANPGEFVISAGGTCAGLATLTPAGGATPSCTVKVAFKPTAFGTKNATVTVTGRVANSTATTQASATLTGIGRQSFTVTVLNSGTGTGTVTGGAINCGSACTTSVVATTAAGTITLTAAASAGSSFAGWTGDCASSNPSTSCTLTVDANKNAGAAFDIQRFSLTPVVSAAPGSGGTLTSSDGLITCSGASCSPVQYGFGTVVHLTAAARSDSRFTGWSGDCAGQTGTTCDVTMTQARAATANFLPNANYAFVTSTAYTLSELATKADVSGTLSAANVVAGADIACGERAAAVNLPGNYKAWIASSGGSAPSRLGAARGWLRTDGRAFADALPGNLFYSMERDEAGAAAPLRADVLTNADNSGAAQGSCSDFTAATGNTAVLGSTQGGSVDWSRGDPNGDCAGSFRLYCLGTDNTAAVVPPAQPSGRILFVSSGNWGPLLGGILTADGVCTTEAAASTLPGTYKAVLAATGASAASRFTTRGAPVIRPDNVIVATTEADLFADTQVTQARVERTAAGVVVPTIQVWTGATSPLAAGADTGTCTNWSVQTGTGAIGYAGYYLQLYSADTDMCSSTQRVFCLQE